MDVVVVGAGLAGLACARELAARGARCTVLESHDRVGGRVATDEVEGFLVDRGFQVLLDSYPEARRVLDLDALELRAFRPGALVRRGGRFHPVVDPWRAPLRGLSTLRAPFFRSADALRTARLRADAARGACRAPGGTAAKELAARGFSRTAVLNFFEPFFAGVTLDPALGVASEFFLELFACFARGSAVLPARGMRAIPEQLASGLPEGSVRTGARVTAVARDRVELADGTELRADRVVLATDASAAAKLVRDERRTEWFGTATLSYAAERSPLDEPILVLAGDDARDGPVNHVCVPSDAQPTYAPPGAALISVSVVGDPPDSDAAVDTAARAQLSRWFGDAVRGWRLLRIDRVPRALPRRIAPLATELVVCGDHVATPSIQGALASGAAAARSIASRGTAHEE
ncbi:MAG: NAD(P)/FAD-dependent oxidoreductase [Planctomycetota bacterium]